MDLTTNYLGLTLRSPLIVGAAAPLTEELDNLKKMEDAGAGAIVLHSLFEEQIRKEKLELHHHFTYGTNAFAEALDYFPENASNVFHVGVETYLEHIQTAKSMVRTPIIASLNGSHEGEWEHTAQLMEQAGADAIELNIYTVPTDIHKGGSEVEYEYIKIVRTVKENLNIPVAVKLSPFFSNMANMAKRLVENGADGLVFFNRFYQPDIDIENLKVTPDLILSSSLDMRLPMRWIAILYGRLDVDFAATSGIQKGTDAIKMLMAGATVTALVATLLRHGIGHIATIEQEMIQWLEEHEYLSLEQLRGSMSQINCPDESEYERAQYMRAIQSYHPDTSIL
ncbi:dihydroorotate dehydrogenase [[Synechococcus] sp. NIES-970]|uniref:dihydroorotate dehydrogenase-like protein n=1 Tax=Picosynechococcus sp. NKBG15041c TaxID=1407650 RepID=UPI000407FA4F|nr:dihydroorotate dehydrogenase-like protein [Picosynechococcus sp. NKBG15041c]BAW96648.1 dihydroorotate dehydrogenase [[Synechococcus] sp. NIES-970]